jgi:SAM-dependent methyltransferase
MDSPVSQTLIDAAKAYETLFVPALFGQWAPMVADAARIERGDRVLDIACGTGVLAREAASRTGPSGHVAGLDPNAGMLAVARSLAPGIDWRDGAAEALPFPDGSFDVVVCQFGLMFFSDRDKAIGEMLRVLAPGGRCVVAVWDGIESAPAFAALVGLLDQFAGRPAGDALRAPFVLGDSRALASLFEGAGANSVNVTTRDGAARFTEIREFVEAELRGWLPAMGVMLTQPQIDRILADAEAILARFVAADGFAFDISAHLATCRRK